MSARMFTRRRVSHVRGTLATLGAAFALFGIAGLAAWVAIRAPDGVPLTSHYTVSAQMRDLANLGAHNEVRVAGRRVGQVLHPRVVGGQPTIDLQLDDAVGPLRADSRLVVRSKGLLGQRYLQLIPGTRGSTIAGGGMLPSRAASATVQLPEIFSAFDATTRARLRPLIDELGIATAGRGPDLGRTLQDAPPFFADLRAVSTAILDRRGAARRLVPSVERSTAAADLARVDVAAGLAPERDALKPFAAQASALRATLDLAPGVLMATRADLAATDPLLAAATRLARSTARTLPAAPAALRRARALLATSRVPLRRAAVLLDHVAPTVAPVLQLARRLTPLLPRVDGVTTGLIPALDVLGPRGCDIRGFASNWKSMLGFGVPGGGAVGPLTTLRLELIVGQETLGGLAKPLDSAHIGRNPYPAPCAAGTERLP
jgi:ABC-type transporter Mla subunit MlaD